MLSENNIQSSYRIASNAFAMRRTIAPIAESPLALATKTTLTEFQVINDVNLDGRCATANGISEMLKEATNLPDGFGYYIHDQAISELVKTIAPTVQKNFYLAKNAVIPATNKAMLAYQTKDTELQKAGITDYSIEAMKLAPVWSNASFQDMVSRYADVTPQPVYLRALGLDITPDNVMGLISTGIASFDADNIRSFDPGYVSNVLNRVFGKAVDETIDTVISVEYAKMNQAVFVFLAAKNYIDNVPEGLNIDLADYRLYMTTIMAQAGRKICAMFRRIEDNRRRKNFVITVDGTRLIVEEQTWFEFCNNGGDPEVLFGSLLSEKNFDFNHLIQNKDRYHQTYETYLNSQRHKFEGMRYDALRTVLYTSIWDAAMDLWSAENKAIVASQLQSKINALQVSDFTNIYVTIRNLICEVTYPGTDICRILDLYDTCAPQVTSNNPREIAALTLIYYVTDWLTEQVKVESFSYPPEL
jgi:hypothetical protein